MPDYPPSVPTDCGKEAEYGFIGRGLSANKTLPILASLLAAAGIRLTPWVDGGRPSEFLGKRFNGVLLDLEADDLESLRRAPAGHHDRSLRASLRRSRIPHAVFLRNAQLPLGHAFGGTLELEEVEAVLQGRGPFDLTKFSLEAASEILLVSGCFAGKPEARKFLKARLLSGNKEDSEGSLSPGTLPESGHRAMFSAESSARTEKIRIRADRSGYIRGIFVTRFEELCRELQHLHPGAGFLLHRKTGDRVREGDSLLEIRMPAGLRLKVGWSPELLFVLSPTPPEFQPTVLEKNGFQIP